MAIINALSSFKISSFKILLPVFVFFFATAHIVGAKPSPYPILRTPSQLQDKIRPGDLIAFDIDKTIMKTGEHKYEEQSDLLNLDLGLSQFIDNWHKSYPASEQTKQIQVIFLTSRSPQSEQQTQEQLQKLGFSANIPIIFTPNLKEGATKRITKGQALLRYIEDQSNTPKRIIVLDDLKANLDNIDQTFKKSPFRSIPLNLFLKQVSYKLFESTDHPKTFTGTSKFPNQLTKFTYVKHIGGGSGGVHVIKDSHGTQFTFKCVADPEQMKEEITADALYRSLGIAVPEFAVYDHLPHLPELSQACKGPGPYRLADYVEPDKKADSNKMKFLMAQHFVADALLSNWDVVIGGFKNVILDKKSTLWRIDNGGSLRYRAVGDKKIANDHWDPFQVTELKTMRDPQLSREGANVYGDLTDDALKAQAQNLYNHKGQLFDTLKTIAQSIQLSNPSEIKEMLWRRLDDLAQRFQLSQEKIVSPTQSKTHLVPEDQHGAGILIYTTDPHTGKILILLGKRNGHRWSSNFGGKSDIDKGELSDKMLAETAVREVQEESLGLINYTPLQLDQSPSHDIRNESGVYYRMYIAPHPYFSVKRFKDAEVSPAYLENVQKFGWEKEYTDYIWMPLETLLSGLKEGEQITEENQKTIKIDDVILYPPFLEMLQEPEVRQTLEILLKKSQIQTALQETSTKEERQNLEALNRKLRIAPRHTVRAKDRRQHFGPLTLEEEKRDLATTTVHHGMVIGELGSKKTPTNREQPLENGTHIEAPSCQEQRQRNQKLLTFYEELLTTPQKTIEAKLDSINETIRTIKKKDYFLEHQQKKDLEKMLNLKRTLSEEEINEKMRKAQDRLNQLREQNVTCIADLILSDKESQESDPSVKEMAGYLSDKESDAIKEEWANAPYTQSQAHMATIMEEEKLKELNGIPQQEILTYLSTYSKFPEIHEKASDDYKQALISALTQEKDHKDKVVFYHAADSLSCFLYDLLSAFRAQLKLTDPEKFRVMRGIDTPFAILKDVEAFIDQYKDEMGEVINYRTVEGVHYADMGLSVNPFLFGNDGNPTSCTYYLFYTQRSVEPINHEKFVNAFMTHTGIPGSFKNYKAIYQQFYQKNNKEGQSLNGKLFQILIDPQVVDTIAYTAGSLGRVMDFPIPQDNQYHGFAKILNKLRTTPTDFEDKLLGLQGRLFLKPNVVHNPSYVQINQFWHHSVSAAHEKAYHQSLNTQVQQDLSRWLASQAKSAPYVLGPTDPKLKKLYQELHKGKIGLNYSQVEGVELLKSALKEANYDVVKMILDRNPTIDLNKKITTGYREDNQASSYFDLIPENATNKTELAILLVWKGAKLLDQLGDNKEALGWRSITSLPYDLLKIVNELFNGKTSPDVLLKAFSPDSTGKTLLHYAVSFREPPIAKLLLEKTPDLIKGILWAADHNGRTPLHYAVTNKNEEIVRLVIENAPQDSKAPLFSADDLGKTPLHYAISPGKDRIVELILAGYPYDPKDQLLTADIKGNTPLHLAAMYNLQTIFQILKSTNMTKSARKKLYAPNLENYTPEMYEKNPPPPPISIDDLF